MQYLSYLRLGWHRNAPRLWLEGRRLFDIGAMPGTQFRLLPDPANRTLTIEITEDGTRRVSGKATNHPVIDLNFHGLADILGNVNRVKATFLPGRIIVTIHPDDAAAEERLARVQAKLKNGQPLTVGSLCHGGGILDAAMHDGMGQGDLETEMAFAVDIEPRYLETSLRNNPIWRAGRGLVISGSLDEIDPNSLGHVDLLLAGLSCTGASLSGRARLGLEHPESHPTAGHLFVPFLAIVKACQPAVVLLENVTPYQGSASMAAIRAMLAVLGYDLHETHLDGNAMGALEDRRRLVVMAVTRGLDFSWQDLQPVRQKEPCLGVILDPAASGWSTMAHLKEKQKRDHAKYKAKGWGTGFQMQIVDASASSVPTIGTDYHKVRSTEPKLRHPENPDLLRQFTPAEHAAIKAIPFDLVAGEVRTLQHQMLGQSVVYPAFVAVGLHLARHLVGAARDAGRKIAQGLATIAPVVPGAAPGGTPAQQLALSF